MPKPALLPAQYIDSNTALRDLAKVLQQHPLLAIDTESNSLYAYQEQVCLFQVSTREADYIIDPLAIDDMRPLGDLLENPDIEKVFHAAEYDIMCIKRDYGYEIRNLFDTMVAARVCAYQAVGLNSLLESLIGVSADKRHQRDNWGKRPLSRDSLLYAQMDTHYLPTLRDLFYAELESRGCMEEAQEIFQDVCNIPAAAHTFDPEGYWRIGKPKGLSRREMAILRELYLLRERLAEKRGTPPFKVFSNAALIALAQVAPRRKDDIATVRGMTSLVIRRYGDAILKAVQRGQQANLPKRPRTNNRLSPEAMDRYNALREWRKNRASQRGVESDVIISKDTLRQLAEHVPESMDDLRQIPGLGSWRQREYGAELLSILKD